MLALVTNSLDDTHLGLWLVPAGNRYTWREVETGKTCRASFASESLAVEALQKRYESSGASIRFMNQGVASEACAA